jgi:hypothetical protein
MPLLCPDISHDKSDIDYPLYKLMWTAFKCFLGLWSPLESLAFYSIKLSYHYLQSLQKCGAHNPNLYLVMKQPVGTLEAKYHIYRDHSLNIIFPVCNVRSLLSE